MFEEDQTKSTSTSEVYNSIHHWIVSGVLNIGTKLPSETSLSNDLGVSRVTVRRALETLRDEYLVESRRGSGNYVVLEPTITISRLPRDDPKSFVEMLGARRIVEAGAARAAAMNCTQSGSAKLNRSIERLLTISKKPEPRWEDIRAEDFRFHETIWALSSNRTLVDLMSALRLTIGPEYQSWAQISREDQETVLAKSIEQHREIAKAISLGDADSAEQAMSGHVNFLEEHWKANFLPA